MGEEIGGDDGWDLPTDDELSDIKTVTYGQGITVLNATRGDRIKINPAEMTLLKDIIDTEINPPHAPVDLKVYSVAGTEIDGLKIAKTLPRLSQIQVRIEKIEGRVLVKVGPNDLSGVGGHTVREQIIRDVVSQALKAEGMDKEYNYESVNVSACVGVRGRAQMFKGIFFNNRAGSATDMTPGSHMNAYVKTAGEMQLTHWEPRKGPQAFYNDTICAMVTSTATSLFEKGVRDGSMTDSAQATTDILKNPELKRTFKHVVKNAQDAISRLLQGVKSMVGKTSVRKDT